MIAHRFVFSCIGYVDLEHELHLCLPTSLRNYNMLLPQQQEQQPRQRNRQRQQDLASAHMYLCSASRSGEMTAFLN